MPQAARFPENLTGDEVLALLASLRGGEARHDDVLREALEVSTETLARPVRTLSGGTRQKLSAIVALRHEAPVLILDEPTAGLDPLTSRLKELVRQRVSAGSAVLLTSHVMAEVEELADALVYLVDGRVRFRGSLDELRFRTGQRRVEQAIAHLMRRWRERSADGPGLQPEQSPSQLVGAGLRAPLSPADGRPDAVRWGWPSRGREPDERRPHCHPARERGVRDAVLLQFAVRGSSNSFWPSRSAVRRCSPGSTSALRSRSRRRSPLASQCRRSCTAAPASCVAT